VSGARPFRLARASRRCMHRMARELPVRVSCPTRAEFYANGFSLVITKTSQPRNYQWINGLENLSDHIVAHMCHVIHTEQATSVRSSPRPRERPEAAWSNIAHTGGKRPSLPHHRGGSWVDAWEPQHLPWRGVHAPCRGPASRSFIPLAPPVSSGIPWRWLPFVLTRSILSGVHFY
jgi:hypothetical protein